MTDTTRSNAATPPNRSHRATPRVPVALVTSLVACGFAFLAGCKTTTTPAPAAQPQTRVKTGNASAPQQPANPPSANLDPSIMDPCVDGLHDVGGQLMAYFGKHGRLPATLDELQPLYLGHEPNYVCPVSKKPFVYVPEGLSAAGNDRLLLVYDAQPAHRGSRWGILFGTPRGAAATWVVPLPENVFRTYAAPPPVDPQKAPAP